MTAKEEQKEEDYYPSIPQYRPHSPYPEVTTTLVPVPMTAQKTIPEKRPKENQKIEHDNLEVVSEMRL